MSPLDRPICFAPAARAIRRALALALLAGAFAAAGPAASGSRFEGPRWSPAPEDSAAFAGVRRRLAEADSLAAASSGDARARMRVRVPLRLAADSVAARLHERLAAARPADSIAMAQALLLRYDARVPVMGLRDSTTREVLYDGFHLLERRLGPRHPGLLPGLARMVNAYDATQNLRRAVETGERRVAILDALAPTDSLDLADALTDLCGHRALLGDFERAEAEGRRGLAIVEAARGPGHPEVAEALVDVSNCLFRQARYREAAPLLHRALAIRERAPGPGSDAVALTLHNLAANHAQRSDPDSALLFGERALAVWELPANSANANIGNTLTLLGQLARQTGDYERARDMLERGLAVRRRASAPLAPAVAQAVESLAGLLEEMGDYAAAFPLREESVRIREKAQGATTPEYAAALAGAARLRVALRRPAEALPLAERAVAVVEQSLGPANERLSSHLATLGDAQRALGEARPALASYERARAIDAASGRADRAAHVPLLRRIGIAHLVLGEPARAESVLAAAAALAGRTLGAAHPLALDVADDLAHAERDLGRPREALARALAAERAGRELFRLQAPTLSERQALRYASVRPSGLPLALDLATGAADPAGVLATWDALLHRRGQVLDEMAERRRAVRRTEDALTDSLRRDWERAARALGALLAGGAAGEPSWPARVATARARLERAETALGARSRAFRDVRARESAGLADVARALPEGAALVAFARHAPSLEATLETREDDRLVAFVLPARGAKAVAVELREAAEVDSLCRAWRAAMRPDAGTEAAAAAGAALREAVWDPVAARLAGAKRVFVVPEGELNLVNFAALPASGGTFLAESGPEFHLLPGERDLLPARETRAGRGLLALGGVAFDAAAPAAEGTVLAAAARPAAAAAAPAWRGAHASCARFRDVRFEPLPATAREAERVAARWTRGESEVVRLTGAAATEDAVRRWAPGRRIVHLATHGFFVDPRCGPGEAGGRGIGGMAPAADTARAAATPDAPENPLRLAGLALAGANGRASAPEGGDDGILTAEELAALDLAGVEWVVLSACDTGVGATDAGEGVFGLRRALRVAGAGTVIASLWAVEDEPALRWMEALYERRLVRRQDTAASVNGAMRDELARRRAAGESTHPFYWAGFVASGDWR